MIGNVFFVYNGQVFGNVFVFIHFFACGLLLADLYTNGIIIFRNEKLGFMLGIAALASLFFIASIGNMTGYLIKLVSIFLLMHIVLTNPMWKRLFSFRLITIIGGMCYSIYLIHFAVISIVGKILLKYSLGIADRFYFIPYMIIFMVCILFMSGVYFLLVEKPFMKLGTWGRRSVLKKEKEVTAV
jgi:peptidoglycan/LPS O-acetylase OafA/YrhL